MLNKIALVTIVFMQAAIAGSGSANPEIPDGPIPGGQPGKVIYSSIKKIPPSLRKTLEGASHTSNSKFEEFVSGDEIRNIDRYREHIRADAESSGLLQIRLSDTSKSDLSQYAYEGLIPDGPVPEGPWTSVTRVFSRPDGVPIFLSEWDYVIDGGAIVVVRELMNVRIGKTPGRMVVKHAPDGRSVTELTWTTPKMNFALVVGADVVNAPVGSAFDRQWLLSIAERLR